MAALADVDVPDDVAAEALAGTVVIKLNGGLGTSMGLDRAKSLLRRCATGADLPRHHRPAGARAAGAYDVRLPLLFMDSFRTREDTLAALGVVRRAGRRRPAAGLPAEQGAQAPRRRPDPGDVGGGPVAGVVPAGARRPLHRAASAAGCCERMIDAGYTRVFVSNSDNLGAVPDPRVAGWFAASGAPFAIEAVRRTPERPQGRPLRPAQERRPDRAARDRADPRRGQGGAGRPRPAPLLLDEQPVVRPRGDARRARRARRHPRAGDDQEHQDRRPRRPRQPRGDPDRDRDGRGDRGLRRRRARSRSAATASCR